jgi:hypothetical protein
MLLLEFSQIYLNPVAVVFNCVSKATCGLEKAVLKPNEIYRRLFSRRSVHTPGLRRLQKHL